MSRTYSKELLEEYEAKDFEYNGKKMTEYEALQEQRHIERQIRRWKREQNAMTAAGLDASEATAKVREWNGKHKDFLEQTGLKADGTRLVVGKYGRAIESSAGYGIIEMTRKKRDGYVEPMPKKQLHRIVKNFKKIGGTIQMNDATDKYLTSKNAEAITYDDHTILLKQNPGRAAVFEELIHATQYRTGENDGSYLSRLKCEISAQKKLLENREAYRLTEAEIKQTEKALSSYQNELREYINGG